MRWGRQVRWLTSLFVTSMLGIWLIGSCSVRSDVPPGSPCSVYEPCPSSMICVDEACTFSCDFSGDCDPAYACVSEVCAPRCETAEDCREGIPCRTQGPTGVSYCGRSLEPQCAQDAECPDDWICVTGGRCIDACGSDSECRPNEACYAVDTYGLCRPGQRPGSFEMEPDAGMIIDAGNPNNTPVDRNCRDRPEGWCESSFGDYQVCYLGACITAPRAVLVLDRSSGEACEPGDGPEPSGGIDLVGVYDASGSSSWATVGDVVVEEGGSDRSASVKTGAVDVCEAAIGVATGCGGWVALEARLPIEEGTVITVAEAGAVCGDTADDRYRVALCTDVRSVILGRDTTSCTIVLGEGTGERSFEVVY